MKENELEKIMELFYSYFKKRLISDGIFTNVVKRENATVTSVPNSTNIGQNVKVAFYFDKNSFSVRNETGIDLKQGDLVCIEYAVDLKNAIAVYKVN